MNRLLSIQTTTILTLLGGNALTILAFIYAIVIGNVTGIIHPDLCLFYSLPGKQFPLPIVLYKNQ